MMKFSVLFALVCVSSAFPEFTVDVLRKELSAFQSGSGESNVVEWAQKLELNRFIELVTKAGLIGRLSGPGPFTIFGPTDAAFAELPTEVMETLEKDTKFLTDVILYHVLDTEVYSSQLKNEQLAPSLFKPTSVRINIYGGLVTATGSPISKPDTAATNGVIHVIDRVMFPIPMNDIPTSIANNGNFSTLMKAVEVAGLVDALKGGPYTMFAPTNEAFEKLPPGELARLLKDKDELVKIITYHLVQGTFFTAAWKHGDDVTTIEKDDVTIGVVSNGRVSVNQANVIYADAAATNGVAHVIDAVLLPPDTVFQSLIVAAGIHNV